MINRITLLGHLGKDPKSDFTQGGKLYARFSLATNERWKDREGETQERTAWHQCVVWGRLSEVVTNYCYKGRLVYVEGRLSYREFEDVETGQTRKWTDIVVDKLQLLGSNGRGNGGGSAAEGEEPGGGEAGEAAEPEDSDIPF